MRTTTSHRLRLCSRVHAVEGGEYVSFPAPGTDASPPGSRFGNVIVVEGGYGSVTAADRERLAIRLAEIVGSGSEAASPAPTSTALPSGFHTDLSSASMDRVQEEIANAISQAGSEGKTPE